MIVTIALKKTLSNAPRNYQEGALPSKFATIASAANRNTRLVSRTWTQAQKHSIFNESLFGKGATVILNEHLMPEIRLFP